MRTRRFSGYRRLTIFASAVIAAVAVQQVAYGVTGSLDKTFHTDGRVQTDIAGFDFAWDMTIDASGRIIAVGQAAKADAADFAIVRYLPNGNTDSLFGPSANGKVTVDFGFKDVAADVAIDAQGRIVVVGTSDEGDDRDWVVARLMPNGALDTTFGSDHTGKIRMGFGGDYDEAHAVAIDALNRIVVVGTEQDGIADESDFGIIRLNSDGSFDSSFDFDGLLTIGFGDWDDAYAVAIDVNGRIVVAGRHGAPASFAAARINDNGTLNALFDGDGKVTTSFGSDAMPRSVAIDSAGRIVLAGYSVDPNGHRQMGLIRYLDDGSLDNLFGSGGKAVLAPTTEGPTSEAFGVAIDAEDRIVAAGYYNAFGKVGTEHMAVARFTHLGARDATFGPFNGLAIIGNFPSDVEIAEGVALDAQGRIVIAGVVVDGDERNFGVARLNSVETADMAITKTADVSTAMPGDTVRFTLSTTAFGPDPAELVTVTDLLPSGLTFVSCSVSAWGVCGGTGNNRTISYALGRTDTIELTATVDSGLADGTVLTNTASIASATTLDPVTSNNTSSTNLVIRNKSDLLLTQRATKLANRRLAFALTVRNNGPYEARQLLLNNPMPNGTLFLGVDAGSWTCVELPSGSVGTLACTLPSLPSSGTTTATLTFEVKATAPGSVDITNTATVSAATYDPNLANNSATLVTRVSGK